MPTRTSEAVWEGDLKSGRGTVRLGSGLFEGPYSVPSRFESGAGTNPEELIGAAHAGCFSMALAAALTEAGHPPARIHTRASVRVAKGTDGWRITSIELDTEATVPGISGQDFLAFAEKAKETCPVSKALAGTKMCLTARLAPTSEDEGGL